MDLQFSYRRRSAVTEGAFGLAIALEPNLRRDRVSFRGRLKHPLRFREAMSALHDVVISDLRYKPRDKSGYQQWLAEQQQREAAIRSGAEKAKKAELAAASSQTIRPGLEAEYSRQRKTYWDAREQYSRYLMRHDPEVWRLLMPCDPVITVAPDSLFFECFSADESSYGCLTVARDAFTDESDVRLGTTNVDYTWSLYEHFQKLRSYRETRFEIDPSGFEVTTSDSAGHREEKIDLPNSWLRGFMQLQSAMSLPMRRVSLGREGLYNIIAWLKRHRASKSPRAIRFELQRGKPTDVVLEPWEKRFTLHSSPYEGAKNEVIRVWGRDRLRVLARLLPLVDEADVYLLGTGLPSFWVARMGEMRLILGLSGWTTNDWTAASALDQIAPPAEITEAMLVQIASAFQQTPMLPFETIAASSQLPKPTVAAGLNRLALLGQVIHDLPAGLYRWRQVMPTPLTSVQVGQDNIETIEANRFLSKNQVTVVRTEKTPTGLTLLEGRLPGHSVELLIDGDGRMVRGQCKCSHHFKNGLRKGPCRHLQALRNKVFQADRPSTLDRWFSTFWS